MALHWDISKISRWKQKMKNRNNDVFLTRTDLLVSDHRNPGIYGLQHR